MGVMTSPASVVYTDASRRDVGELGGVTLDLEVGDTDDFQLTAPASYPVSGGSLVYVDGTSYGGIVDHRVPTTGSPTVTYRGRTWAGIMAERVICPPAGADWYEYDCDANALLRALVSSLDLSWLFEVPSASSGIRVRGRFERYCDMWSGIRRAAREAGARVSVTWGEARVSLSMVARSTIEANPGEAPATVDEAWGAINHLVCLGRGELRERLVIHLYADESGNVSRTRTLTGARLREATYDYSNADEAELVEQGTKKLRELQEAGSASVDSSALDEGFELGDLLQVTDDSTGATVTAEVTRLVVRVEDGQLSVSCEAGAASITGALELSGSSESDGLSGERAREALAAAALAQARADEAAEGATVTVDVYVASVDWDAGTGVLAADCRVGGAPVTPTAYSWTRDGSDAVLGTAATLEVSDLSARYSCAVTVEV